jgi:hypothetical protein
MGWPLNCRHGSSFGGGRRPKITTNEPNAALAGPASRAWADEGRTLPCLLAGSARRSAAGSGLASKSQCVACLMPGACHESVEG